MRFKLPDQLLIRRQLVVLVLHLNDVKTPTITIERFDACDQSAPVSNARYGSDPWIGVRNGHFFTRLRSITRMLSSSVSTLNQQCSLLGGARQTVHDG